MPSAQLGEWCKACHLCHQNCNQGGPEFQPSSHGNRPPLSFQAAKSMWCARILARAVSNPGLPGLKFWRHLLVNACIQLTVASFVRFPTHIYSEVHDQGNRTEVRTILINIIYSIARRLSDLQQKWTSFQFCGNFTSNCWNDDYRKYSNDALFVNQLLVDFAMILDILYANINL